MKPNTMVVAVILFGLIAMIVTPHFIEMAVDNTVYETQKQNELANTTETVNDSSEAAEAASNVDLAIATPVVEETKEETKEEMQTVEEVKTEQEETPVVTDPIVYDGLTMKELVAKLDKSLNSTLKGTGNLYAKYSLEYGVDPYLVTAISLHETGCKWNCSTNVKQCNNVGGMKGGSNTKCNGTSYSSFESLEAGIKAFIYNIKINYFDKGLTTAEQMNKKYAASGAWSAKVNVYMNNIKNS